MVVPDSESNIHYPRYHASYTLQRMWGFPKETGTNERIWPWEKVYVGRSAIVYPYNIQYFFKPGTYMIHKLKGDV